MANNVITVSALNRYVKTLLESDPVLTDVALQGEISNFKNHFKTGHLYFSLKDEESVVNAVMFRSDAQYLNFEPQDGMRVVVRCRISLYERTGSFQIYVENMFPDGIGAMQMAYEQLKEKLANEGLFAPEHKQMLPTMPRCVGLVTSKTGAAIQDIFNVTRRRYPMAHFFLYPVNVQGLDAAPEIVNAIQTLDANEQVDVIIVARGGGSQEDLWVFNNEQIARAAYTCKTPIVSAIGHEIDYCILDFVADLRAPTPSAAAEMVMPDMAAQYAAACKVFMNIRKEIQNKMFLCYNRHKQQAGSVTLAALRSKPRRLLGYVKKVGVSASAAMVARIKRNADKLSHAAQLAHSLNPYGVLARGYGIVRQGGQVLKSCRAAHPKEEVAVELLDGSLLCTLEKIRMKEDSRHEKTTGL